MKQFDLEIDVLIKLIKRGGFIKTGINVYNDQGVFLINKNTNITDPKILENVKRNGMRTIPINMLHGGLFDKSGKKIPIKPPRKKIEKGAIPRLKALEIESKIEEQLKKIKALREEAIREFTKVQQTIKQTFKELKESGGFFNTEKVFKAVDGLHDFMSREENAFSLIPKDVFSWDDYFFTHSTSICTTGITILKKYNKLMYEYNEVHPYTQSEIRDISVGYLLQDIGKAMLPEDILNIKGKFTDQQMDIMKTHSYIHGPHILNMNKIDNPLIHNCVKYHHGELYDGEERCYPNVKYNEIPEYVKICKLADIFDAMTSKRSYKEAQNPVSVVTGIFRSYANKETKLQFVLHSFVKSIGIYPPGSIVTLNNLQNAYVLDSKGPTIIPLTDKNGKALANNHDPIDLSENVSDELKVDSSKPLMSPKDAYSFLPEYLKNI